MEVYSYEGNYFHEEGDSEYVYYMVYDKDTHTYDQNWILKDGDYMYQVCASIPAKDYYVEETGSVIAIPKYCKEVKENDWLMNEGAAVGFESDYLGFPSFCLYKGSADVEYTESNIKERWGVDSAKVSPKYYFGEDGPTVPGFIINTTKTRDGSKYLGTNYVIRDKGYGGYTFITFVYPADAFGIDYTKVAERAIVTSHNNFK